MLDGFALLFVLARHVGVRPSHARPSRARVTPRHPAVHRRRHGGLFAGADGNTAEGADIADIADIAAPGNGDVALGGEEVVSGVSSIKPMPSQQ